jgi:hypothetical protein
MEHFSEQTWVNYVRGIDASGTVRAIETHLSTGCTKCRTAIDSWKAVLGAAANESRYTPPEDLVRMVKLEFACKQAHPPQASTIASLIFDSAAQPLPAGIRSGVVTTRQFVYESEGLTVDLRFERLPHSNRYSASGQILDRQAPFCWMGNAMVVLWTDSGRMLTTTEANDYGEFQLEFEANDQLRISIATVGRRTLRIPLGNIS